MHSNAYKLILNSFILQCCSSEGFNSSRKLFEAEIVTIKLKAVLSNTLLCIRPLTFINEVLRLSGSPFVASTASP